MCADAHYIFLYSILYSVYSDCTLYTVQERVDNAKKERTILLWLSQTNRFFRKPIKTTSKTFKNVTFTYLDCWQFTINFMSAI